MTGFLAMWYAGDRVLALTELRAYARTHPKDFIAKFHGTDEFVKFAVEYKNECDTILDQIEKEQANGRKSES